MNLPNKITFARIILSIFLLILLIFPLHKIGIELPILHMGPEGKTILVDVKYLIAGVIFVIAAATDFVDGHLARKYNMVTDLGKVMDAIADKMLVNGVLIILAVNGFISVVVPVVIVTRDIMVDSIKMVAGKKEGAVGASIAGKVKTVFMLIGITLTFFYNMPFEFYNLDIAQLLILVATVLSVISGVEYYVKNKNLIFG
jgi:CDP-diacylglycerol--glycerol-3-phosphate 3-phosphatidyltransferase